MNLVQLLPVGTIEGRLMQGLKEAIPRSLRVCCEVLPVVLDPRPAFHAERQQYHSSEILQRMQCLVSPRSWRLLAVASVDLYIPILKYVLGEAQMGGPCALVSSHRLHQEFYGLAGDDDLLAQRLLKESIHELGHTLDLRHCQDYRCAMASAHAVEWVDIRGCTLCDTCETAAWTAARVRNSQASIR
jgi:archaemetzincin